MFLRIVVLAIVAVGGSIPTLNLTDLLNKDFLDEYCEEAETKRFCDGRYNALIN